MDTMQAFMRGEANRNKELMVFDWSKARRIIDERGVRNASAGLEGDWEWTGGEILENGKPVHDSYTYLASTWAKPLLRIDDGDDEEEIECWRMQSNTPGWDASTKWPDDDQREDDQ